MASDETSRWPNEAEGDPEAGLQDPGSTHRNEDETASDPPPDSQPAGEFEDDLTVVGFPPVEERSGPEGEEDPVPSSSSPSIPTNTYDDRQNHSGDLVPEDIIAQSTNENNQEEEERREDDPEDEDDEDEDDPEQYDSVPSTITSSQILPWGAPKERSRYPSSFNIDTDIKPGEFVMRTLFAEFTIEVEKKISAIMGEPLERPLSKSLQRGEDFQFDQLLQAFGNVGEHCLPSLLKTLFGWYDRQGVEWVLSDYSKGKADSKGKSDLTGVRSELEFVSEKRDLAIEFIFCLVLIEVLKQLHVHPGHEELVRYIEDIAFRHFKFRDSALLGPNAANMHMIADLYAEVLGVLAQSRFLSIKRRFFAELRDLRAREPSTHSTQSIISLLMGMKFFRVKMVPFEDFEHSFQFMQECAQYFLEVKDKDIKHAVAGLFVEILVPVAAAVKNEVNVPCLKNFVEKLYSQTLDMCTRNKHRLAIFPLVTCLLCVSQKAFFIHNWHYFLTMCLQQLKNRENKMARVALESLYRLLWVYMIRIKCESNNVTQSRLQSIVNSLFPKGSKAVVPRDAPLNIFVKIIQFIAQEKLDFAMREIVFDLLSVGRPIKVINAPERMSIGLRSFLVVADSLQQKEGDPPMPRTVAVMPSGSTLRVKKTFLSKMLTDEAAKNIGISSYYPYVRKVFDDILRALDHQFGKPLLMINTQNAAKEPDDAKPKLDLFRTVIAAIPRLIPDGMSRSELVDTLARLTVHNDEELRGLAYQSLQNLVNDFPDWREDVLFGFMQFVVKDITDQHTNLLDNALRMVFQLLSAWRNAADKVASKSQHDPTRNHDQHNRPDLATTLHMAEGFALVMLCHCRIQTRKICLLILKEVKQLFKILEAVRGDHIVLDVLDKVTGKVVESCLHLMPPPDKTSAFNISSLDFQWLTERTSSQWTSGFNEEGVAKSGSTQHLFAADPWSSCLMGFLEPDRLLALCPSAIFQAWPTVHTRLTQLFSVVDPAPVTDNRASLLRPGTAPKKTVNEKDISLHLWKNYTAFACRVVPPIPNPIIRCVSPDLLSSSPESLGMDRSDTKSPSPMVSPTVFYKLIVPLLRCEVVDMRDSVVQALGRINHTAIMDLMSEMVVYIREAIDRKQENMRRRRRRDALRLQLVRVFDLIAKQGTFSLALLVTDPDNGGLAQTFTDYIDGARLYLESEAEKEIVPSVREIKTYFSSFIKNLIESFPLERRRNLLKKSLRKDLFYLFAGWSGKFGYPFESSQSNQHHHQQHPHHHNQHHHQSGSSGGKSFTGDENNPNSSSSPIVSTTEFEFSALQSMIAVLCCGTCFDDKALSEENNHIFALLDMLLNSKEKKVYSLAQETIVLLLEYNQDRSYVLEWLVDRCFTGEDQVADGCFLALATVFATREYPCDHYTGIINVTLLNTGCPRTQIHETALQLLQILDKRFFGSISPLGSENEQDDGNDTLPRRSTLDVLLSTTYSRSQLYLSRQLAQLHPEMTMPMFSEICHRLQTARPSIVKCLLYYLLPWLYNMELVDPNVLLELSPPEARVPTGREGWGTTEATEMITNNLFYITVKFGDEHPKEVEELWQAMCDCWQKNLRVIIRYLFIISGLAPSELVEFAKRVVLYLARAQPLKVLEEMMMELQSVETLNCTIERTETPPYFRLTFLRKTSSNSESNMQLTSSRQDLSTEKGTIHTKRHSQEEQQRREISTRNEMSIAGSLKSAGSMASSAGSAMVAGIQRVGEKVRALSGSTNFNKPSILGGGGSVHPQHLNIGMPPCPEGMSQSLVITSQGEAQSSSLMSHSDHQYLPQTSLNFGLSLSKEGSCKSEDNKSESNIYCQPHPLPMPEYGGWFAPLTEFLPHASQPISSFHRSNLAVILLTDLVVDGLDLDCHGVDWSVHVPLMLHIIFLGLDNSRELVYKHCQQLLLNLLIVLCEHQDHLSISSILMQNKAEHLNYGLVLAKLPIIEHNFTESYLPMDPQDLDETQDERTDEDDESVQSSKTSEEPTSRSTVQIASQTNESTGKNRGSTTTGNGVHSAPTVADLTKALIHFIASRKCQPFWQYEDITRNVWSIRSAEQIDVFLAHVLQVFELSLPHSRLAERWSQLSLHLALSCSSRHYAGRSLQIFRALRVPISSRMLSDILSRLVETIAEQGEDMQGYVTELILTLEAVVDALDSDIRPMDLSRDIFKSTPNLKDASQASSGGHSHGSGGMGGHTASANPNQGPSSFREQIEIQHSTSPIGHGYHVSAPPTGPFSRYDRNVSFPRHPTSGAMQPFPSRKTISPVPANGDIRGRSGTESEVRHKGGLGSNILGSTLPRSRSAQSLKLQDQASQDDKMNILVQLFWICLAVLESDYEHEFLLGLRLLERVLSKLPLDRPDVREKVDKLQIQLKWPRFPGVHSLLLKGCTNSGTYEATIQVISQMTSLLDFPVIDPSQSLGFPMNVIALLPYMVQNYEDANDLCIQSAENIAQVSQEKSKKLENLATVMTLYSRRTFSKESFQWTKCVVKYLYDLYSHFSFNMLSFLVEVLEKGPVSTQGPVMTIIHCLLHYIDMSQATQMINADLLRTVAKFIETPHWREALKILKLAVTRSSTLVAPPSNSGPVTYHWDASPSNFSNFSEGDLYFKKELPGRTMEFTFDLSQTPVIGRKQTPNRQSHLYHSGSTSVSTLTTMSQPSAFDEKDSLTSLRKDDGSSTMSPRRSMSISAADSASTSGWKRPWLSQSSVRERLVNLLNSCGQRVGLPKSPSKGP
ncbi:protein furry-like isoform X3 [Tigriopus californicus]|uniref:protein furry-like isoform X3 n=1 Tax=Tigriopus californicus TaxID=6832 RepID=UPI0027DA495F|nr:protein furry-like isoform X3 [Tigriopus californicus]